MKLDREIFWPAIVAGLPLKARWAINGTPLEFDFSIARLISHELAMDLDEIGRRECSNFSIFGKYDYAEGGGASPWLGIRKTDGMVCGLDSERENPIFLLNSTIGRFIRTFGLLNEYLGTGRQLSPEVADDLLAIDPEAYPASDWRLLIECVTK